MKSKSSYTYSFTEFEGIKFLTIIDQGFATTVTNNIENVVQEITNKENINPAELVIIYQDTEGMWDGWNHAEQKFFYLSAHTKQEAITNFYLMQNFNMRP